MTKGYLTHEELQYIEHANKVLENHKKLVSEIINETENLLNDYIPIMSTYVNAIKDIQMEFGVAVKNIVYSAREVKIITSGSQEIQQFITAVSKLEQVMNNEFTKKVIELTTRK